MKHLAKILLATSLALPACRTVIDIPEGDARHDLTVIFSGNTADGLTPQTIRVSRTDFSHFRLKQDARITLTADGQPIPVSAATGRGSKGQYVVSYAFAPGQTIDMRVEQGGGIATARTIVPQLPQLLGFDLEEVKEENERGYAQDRLLWRIRLLDKAGERNYYRISATRQSVVEDVDTREELSLSAPLPVTLNGKSDPIISDGRPQGEASSGFGIEELLQGGDGFANIYAAFSDALFEGKEAELKLTSQRHYRHDGMPSAYYLPSGDGEAVRVTLDGVERKVRYKYHRYTLTLHATSEDLYHYLRSLGRYKTTPEGSPFSSPVQLYSNVSGGTGIVAVSSSVSESKIKVYQY